MAKKKNEAETENEADPPVRNRKKDKEKKRREEPDPNHENIEMSPDEGEVKFKLLKRAPMCLTTREIGKRYLDREAYLKLCIREMLIYIVFLVFLGILAGGQHSSEEYYLTRVMTKLYIEQRFRTYVPAVDAWEKEILSYNEINTMEHVWMYLKHFLLIIHWDYWYAFTDKYAPVGDLGNMVFFQNAFVGDIRMRQLRVKDDSCSVPPDMKSQFPKCYDEFSKSAESTAEYGHKNTSAWKHSTASELCGCSVSGEISSYNGGGFYVDLDHKILDNNNGTVEMLRQGLWLDRGTRAVIIQFTTYNGNENIFFTLRLLLEFPPTGGVIPSYETFTEKYLLRDIWDYVLIFCGVVFVIFVIVFTIFEIYEIFYFKWHYFDFFWNTMDFLILILSYVTIVAFVYSFLLIQVEIPKVLKAEGKHPCIDNINNARETFITLLSVLFFFAAVKLLKYLNFNHSMFQMQMTLSKATKDIACFSIMFFIVFVNFAQLGHLLFGSQVRDFRSFISSVFALLRTAVGDFDYHKIENVNHFLGPVFFFAYIFFIYFILVNMFLAIIIDTYSEVRTSIRDHTKELQMSDIVCGWFFRLLRCCGCRKIAEKHGRAAKAAEENMAYKDVQNLLRRCGFTEMEIDLFFAKFDIPRDRQIPQNELRQKLLTNFNMQPEQEKKAAPTAPEKDEVGEKLMLRIKTLEDNITDVNYKIDLIDNKIDSIQQLRARKKQPDK